MLKLFHPFGKMVIKHETIDLILKIRVNILFLQKTVPKSSNVSKKHFKAITDLLQTSLDNPHVVDIIKTQVNPVSINKEDSRLLVFKIIQFKEQLIGRVTNYIDSLFYFVMI